MKVRRTSVETSGHNALSSSTSFLTTFCEQPCYPSILVANQNRFLVVCGREIANKRGHCKRRASEFTMTDNNNKNGDNWCLDLQMCYDAEANLTREEEMEWHNKTDSREFPNEITTTHNEDEDVDRVGSRFSWSSKKRGSNGGGSVRSKRSASARAKKEEDLTDSEEMTQDPRSNIQAKVFMISGCQDAQTSADVSNVAGFSLPDPNGQAGGACTSALLKGR